MSHRSLTAVIRPHVGRTGDLSKAVEEAESRWGRGGVKAGNRTCSGQEEGGATRLKQNGEVKGWKRKWRKCVALCHTFKIQKYLNMVEYQLTLEFCLRKSIVILPN